MHKQSKSKFLQVTDEAYNGAKTTDQAVLSDNGLDKNTGYTVPLEIKPAGQFEPLYRTKLDVQVSLCFITTPPIVVNKRIYLLYLLFLAVDSRILFFLCICFPSWKDGELPTLPLSVYGAVAMAHSEVSEEYSSPYQFFFYLYDKSYVSSN